MTPCEIAKLVVRMALDNPRWGYTRSRRTPWKTFLQSHWEGLAAADLFTVEVLTLAGLRRYCVLLVIELGTRRVKIAGIHHQPYGEWMEQMARNLTDMFDGFLRNARHLIHDRDPLYTRAFVEILKSSGVQPIRLPPRSPNLNAYAERFVRSIKEECLNRIVPLGESHLRLIVREYVEHYHCERNHQGLENRLLERAPPTANPGGNIQRTERLGGLLSYYYRKAARGLGSLFAPYGSGRSGRATAARRALRTGSSDTSQCLEAA